MQYDRFFQGCGSETVEERKYVSSKSCYLHSVIQFLFHTLFRCLRLVKLFKKRKDCKNCISSLALFFKDKLNDITDFLYSNTFQRSRRNLIKFYRRNFLRKNYAPVINKKTNSFNYLFFSKRP